MLSSAKLVYGVLGTHDDTSNTALRVTNLFQVLADRNENTGRQRHVKDTVRLFSALLELLEVLLQVLERLILIVLTRNVTAEAGELLELFLEFLGGRLDVRFDALQVFGVVHLCSCVSDDLDIFGEVVVAVLF